MSYKSTKRVKLSSLNSKVRNTVGKIGKYLNEHTIETLDNIVNNTNLHHYKNLEMAREKIIGYTSITDKEFIIIKNIQWGNDTCFLVTKNEKGDTLKGKLKKPSKSVLQQLHENVFTNLLYLDTVKDALRFKLCINNEERISYFLKEYFKYVRKNTESIIIKIDGDGYIILDSKYSNYKSSLNHYILKLHHSLLYYVRAVGETTIKTAIDNIQQPFEDKGLAKKYIEEREFEGIVYGDQGSITPKKDFYDFFFVKEVDVHPRISRVLSENKYFIDKILGGFIRDSDKERMDDIKNLAETGKEKGEVHDELYFYPYPFIF